MLEQNSSTHGGQETGWIQGQDVSFKIMSGDIIPSIGPQIIAAHSTMNTSVLWSFDEVSNS